MDFIRAAKAAVIYLANAFSNDLTDRKRRVNVIITGTTGIPAFDKFVPAEQVEALKTPFVSVMPIDRIGQLSDIVKTAVFLASDDSLFMLGAELLVDRGMTYLSNKKKSKWKDQKNKVAVVTGASKGIGAAIAKHLHQKAQVLL